MPQYIGHSSYSMFNIAANIIFKANQFTQGATATLINLTRTILFCTL